ncbi:MAG TPA: hypothetical protein VI685_26545 [Candidatus Angelobacter sp.]
MDTITTLFIVWGALTAVFVILLIYRGTLNMHEDDQLFLDEAESHMAREQQELIVRMNKIQPWVWVFGSSSALLIVVIAGMFVYSHMTR